MSKEGGIILYRKLIDSYAFSNETTLKIWVWLLLKASWKKEYFDLSTGKGTTTVEINRGELVFGRKKASSELKIHESKIERTLKKLQDNNQIVRKSNTHFSVITICNYDTYQSKKNKSEQPTDNQRTTNEQPPDTYNTTNTINNKELVGGKPPAPTKGRNIEERKLEFSESLKEHLETYGRDLLNSFYKYWTEKNSTGKKMRFEMQGTWETNLRLATWASRDKEFVGKNKTEGQQEKEKQLMKSLGL